MTVGAILSEATDRLTAAGVPSPAHDARELLAHVLDRRPPLLGRTDPVSQDQAELFAALLARRTGVAGAQAELDLATQALTTGEDGPDYDTALTRWLDLGGADLDVRA